MQLVSPVSLAEFAAELQAGRVSAVEAVQRSLDRLDATEPSIHAWVEVDRAGAFAQAKHLDQIPAGERGPLHGIPVGVKDIIDVGGLPTRCGSPLRGQSPAIEDAAIVALLRRLGAVIIGKTVTTEFAYFSPGPTANPQDVTRTPGGSSSGSAAAVAAGVVPLALGTQTAASVTRPAAFCGVTGYITARRTLDDSGITGLSESLDTLGFLTASVKDAEYLRRALSDAVGMQQDAPQDRATANIPAPDSRAASETAIGVILVWRPGADFEVSASMATAMEKAAALLTEEGWKVEPLPEDAPDASALTEAHLSIMAHESVRLRAAEASQPEQISPQLAALFESGRNTSQETYEQALSVVERATAWFADAFARGNVVLAPAAQSIAPEGLGATGNPVLSRAWQALGLPVVVVQGARDAVTGMPLGLQLIGGARGEDRLFEVAASLEEALAAKVRA